MQSDDSNPREVGLEGISRGPSGPTPVLPPARGQKAASVHGLHGTGGQFLWTHLLVAPSDQEKEDVWPICVVCMEEKPQEI